MINSFEKIKKAVNKKEAENGIYIHFQYDRVTIWKAEYNTEFYHEEYGGNVNTEIEISLLNHGQKRV